MGSAGVLEYLNLKHLPPGLYVIIVNIVLFTRYGKFTTYYYCHLEFFIFLPFILLCHFLQLQISI